MEALEAPPAPTTTAPQPSESVGDSPPGEGRFAITSRPTSPSLSAISDQATRGSANRKTQLPPGAILPSAPDVHRDTQAQGAMPTEPADDLNMAEESAALVIIEHEAGERVPGSAAPERGKLLTEAHEGAGTTGDDAEPGRTQTPESGDDDVDSNSHTHASSEQDKAMHPSYSTSLSPHRADRRASSAPSSPLQGEPTRQQHNRKEAEDLTPVTVAGEGASVGAEHDATPLISRPSRDGDEHSRDANAKQANQAPATAARTGRIVRDTQSLDSGMNSGDKKMPRKDTITWEAFLANLNVGDGGEEGVGSTSDSSSPADSRLQAGAPTNKGHMRSAPGETSIRSRYLRAMASNVSASLPWNSGRETEDDGNDGVGMPELSEDRPTAVGAPPMPRMLSDLTEHSTALRPAHLDLGRSRSLSAVGGVMVSEARKTLQRGINKFNVNPKDGLKYLLEEEVITDTAESICDFLASEEGLSKRRLGEYFGRDDPKAQKVLSLFLKKLHFEGASLDEALRAMVLRFRLPGEAQQMDRIMQGFSERFHAMNPGVFSCSETAWVLSFALMMLNTDMYNRNIREIDKMTMAQFVKNHRGIDQGHDPPREILEAMYKRIRASEIRMDEGDMYESEVITFVAPKKSGWLKKKSKGYVGKWKKHWFVLNDAVLYYFLAPQHQDEAPRCIIPLERIKIDPTGLLDLSINLRDHHGYVKSVKMMDNGSMEQGNHRSFVLRADSQAERDVWVNALRAEVPHNPMDPFVSSNPASLVATPATSSVATPLGTPSESGRRTSNKFGGGRGDRKRRGTGDAAVVDRMPPPIIRGWARTQSDKQQTGLRRYIALFVGGGPDLQDGIYFFGDSFMCDKMIEQRLRTSHGCLVLSDVSRVQLRQGGGSAGERAIALQTGAGKGTKEVVIVPEENFSSWARHVQESCPDSAYSIAADGTPITSSIGETAFPSVNTVDSAGDLMISSIARTAADNLGIPNDVFVSIGPSTSTVASIDGTVESKGRDSDNYGRTESGETQEPGEAAAAHEMNRVMTMPSAETEPDNEVESGVNDIRNSPNVVHGNRSSGDISSPGTDVE